MKSIQELYPDYDENSYYIPGGYDRLLESFGYDIIIQVDDNDYQGDSRLLYHDKETNKYGYLQFGWGSCSGCDAFQACSNLKEVEDLRNSLYNDIKWYDSVEECLNYFLTTDWEGKYSYGRSEQKDFINKVVKYLGSIMLKDHITSDVRSLMIRIRDTKDFTLCPILADALEDSGYENPVYLSLLRTNTSWNSELFDLAILANIEK